MTNFSGHFERGQYGCADLTYDTGGTPGKIWNISFIVTRDKKTGAIESVRFQGQARDPITNEVFAYDSIDIVLGAGAVLPNPEIGIGFTIHLHEGGIPLFKCTTARVIGKNKCEDLVGTFAVDYMDYIYIGPE